MYMVLRMRGEGGESEKGRCGGDRYASHLHSLLIHFAT
jgi:hypothetical protein